MNNFNIKKFFLYSLIGSVSISGLLGIWAILSGDFGEFQERILVTTLTVVGTSILGLACGSFLENPRSQNSPLKIVPGIGIIFALLAAVSSFLLIWDFYHFDDKGVSKTFFISMLFAFSLAQLSLLSLARLAARFRWSLIAAYVVILFLDAFISLIILAELEGNSDFSWRLIGVLSVAAASLTVMIPIFHRLSRDDFAGVLPISAIDEEIIKLKSRIADLEKQKENASETF